MAGLSHLRDVYDKRGKDFLEGLLNKTVIVNEKMDGAFFGAQKNEETGKFRFFKRNAEITYVDRVLSRYYEPAIRHFENLGNDVISQVPGNYHFGMEWFTSPKAQTIAYDRVPKNGLILSYIHILDDNGNVEETIQDKETLDKWADLLDIERPPIVFQGKLSSEQKEKIQEFVYTPFEELVDKFKTTSFTRYIMSVLNPEMESTFLRDTLDKDIEGLVFRFYDPESTSEDSVFLAKLVDPVFQERAKQKAQDRVQKKSDDYIWIIAIDLMNFIERYSSTELRNFELSGTAYEERYISLINKIYMDFIKEFGQKYADLDIQIPEFLKREEFGVNFNLVKDPEVIKTIESNENFKEVYRILLNVFRKKKSQIRSSLFTKAMKANLNSQIDKINAVIMGDSLFENYFPTFSEFVGEGSEPGYFEAFADLPEESRKAKRVNVIVSDFQPIHQGHIKSAQSLNRENGFPCLFVCVHDGTTNRAKPFRKETVESCLRKLTNSHPDLMVGHVTVPDCEVETLLRKVKPDFEPVTLCATKSRIKDLALQLDLAKKRSRNLNFKRDMKLIELPIAGVKNSIMEAIRSGNYAEFKASAPSSIHSEFFNLNRDASDRVNEAVDLANAVEEKPVLDELVGLLPNLDSTIIAYLLKQAKHSIRKSDKTIKQHLAEKNIPINSTKSIILDAKRLGEEDELLDYLENPTVELEELKDGVKMSEVFAKINLSSTLKAEIMELVDTRSGVSMGAGEIPLAVFMKGGSINITKKAGDVFVGDYLIEVKMSNAKSGFQVASSAYSSRATKAAMFKSNSGQALIQKYGDALPVEKSIPWPVLIFNATQPNANAEGRAMAMDFLNELYPGLFSSENDVNWTSGESINLSIGIALGMDYLKELGGDKGLMVIGLDRDTYTFIADAEEFKAAVNEGRLAFRMASDSVPRCNLAGTPLEE